MELIDQTTTFFLQVSKTSQNGQFWSCCLNGQPLLPLTLIIVSRFPSLKQPSIQWTLVWLLPQLQEHGIFSLGHSTAFHWTQGWIMAVHVNLSKPGLVRHFWGLHGERQVLFPPRHEIGRNYCNHHTHIWSLRSQTFEMQRWAKDGNGPAPEDFWVLQFSHDKSQFNPYSQFYVNLQSTFSCKSIRTIGSDSKSSKGYSSPFQGKQDGRGKGLQGLES